MLRNKKVKPIYNATLTFPKFILFVCLFSCGFITLTYEICWIRKASFVFGTTSFALSMVLALFFAGLALGSYVFGKYSWRTSRPLRLYATLEIGVGVLALGTPVAFGVADVLYGQLYQHVVHDFTLLSAIRSVFLTIILLPPAILIGGTLPLFCRQFVFSERRISRSVGFLYGLNTLGAATGCAVCGFFMLPQIGTNGTIYLGGILSILIGTIVWKLPLTATSAPVVMEQPEYHTSECFASPLSRTAHRTTAIQSLFFLSGFVMLGNEILWTRYLSLLMYNTVYAYTLTLTVILIGIVLGSLLTARFFDRMRRLALVFGAVQVATGITVLTALMLPEYLQSNWVYPTLWMRLCIVAPVLLVPAVLSGVSFPLAIRMVVDQPSKASIGVGTMTAINTAGGIAGSLVVGFFLLPQIGLQATLLVTTCISLLAGFTAWLLLERSLAPLSRYGLIVVSLLVWLAIPFVSGVHLPADLLVDRGELVDFREGVDSTIAIVRKDNQLRLEIDRMWQGGDYKGHQVVAAHTPMLLHSDPKRILVIGIGAGQTASSFLTYPVEQVDCLEIESKLIPLVKQYFESAWMNDERVRFITEDGRNYLTHTNVMYDVISIEVGQTFRPGVASFYTADFYHRARGRLRQKGLLCQFIPITFLTPQAFQAVVRTFLDTFPKSVLWYNTSELLLIGTVGDELKLTANRLAMLTTENALRWDLDFAYWGGRAYQLNRPEVFLAGFLVGPKGLAKLAEGAPIYIDDVPKLEYTASRYRKSFITPNVEIIRACLEPAWTILDDKESGSQMVSLSQSVREKNLCNMVASDIKAKAVQLLTKGMRQEAIMQLRKALQWNPENVETNIQLADELGLEGKLEEAIRYYYQSLRAKPDYAKAHYKVAKALRSQGKLDEAISHYLKALQAEPNYAEAHNNVAAALQLQGKLDEAISHYREALRINPGDTIVYNNLGNALSSQGKLDEAISHYRQALGIKPDLAEAHNNLATVLQLQDKLDEAVHHYRRALKIKPNYAVAHNNLGMLLQSQGNLDEAISHYREALLAKPEYAKARNNLAAALRSQSNKD